MAGTRVFGFICVLLLRKACGQCDAGTRPLNLTTLPEPQYMTSPNYDGVTKYPSNSDCAWLITNPGDGGVIINVQDAKFDLGDSLTIYDGDSAASPQLAQGSFTATNVLNAYVSSGGWLYLTFTSDANFNQDGFNILYFNADPVVQQQCGETYNATLRPQWLMSANLPDLYTGNYSCTSYFQSSHEYYTVTFTLYFLDIQDTAGCASDKFEVAQGSDVDTVTSLHTSCTTAKDYTFSDIVSVYSFAAVSLTTDDDTTNNLGFLLSFVEVYQGITLSYSAENETVKLALCEDFPVGTRVEGITLSYPAENETVNLALDEDFPVGTIDTTLARVNVNTTGPSGVQFIFTQGQNGSVTTLFAMSAGPDEYYIETTSSLDYEDTQHYNLTVTMVDNVYPGLSATARFFINLTDVDDVAPVFTNLPNATSVYRSRTQGYHVFTVSATDADRTPAFTEVIYTIYSGDSANLLVINSTSGDVWLAQDVSTLGNGITSYTVSIAAYSVNVSSGLFTREDLTLNIPLDSPPECAPSPASGKDLTSDVDGAATVIQFNQLWNCTDDNVNISYSILTVTPSLRTPLFSLDNDTGTITLLRTFSAGEVPSRQFIVELGVTDSMDQTTSLKILINVTALKCSPETIYVRMDTETGSVVMNDYNCTGSNKSSLQYAIQTQSPDDTFILSGSSLVLNSRVFKIRFYSLTLEISNGVDTETVVCKVTVRMRQCGAVLSGSRMTSSANITILLAVLAAFVCSNYS